jgi:hypothetical protein
MLLPEQLQFSSDDLENIPLNKCNNGVPTTTIDIERKYILLKVCYVPTTSATFLAFFAAANNSTNETNKAGSTCH